MRKQPSVAAIIKLATLLLVALSISQLSAADKPEKQKFPGPVVTQLLEGWAGLPWGAPLDDFKKKFPDASKTEGGRWVTGKDEDLAGVKVTVQYTFNKKDQLQMLTFVPEEKAGKTFRQTLANAGVLKEGAKGNWQSQGITFGIAPLGDGTQMAIAINAKYADPKEKPK
jgi:hypothetical protein